MYLAIQIGLVLIFLSGMAHPVLKGSEGGTEGEGGRKGGKIL